MAVLTRGFAEAKGSEIALLDDVGTRTFGELDERVNRLVHSMRDVGIGAGDVVAIVCGNCNEWFEIALACANNGVTFVPVNWHLVGPEIAYILGDCGAKAVVTDHRYISEVTKALADDRSSSVQLRLAVGVESDAEFQNYEEFLGGGSHAEPDDQLFGGPMFYTSGTTGNPKGVKSSLSVMPPGTTPEIWDLVAATLSQIVTAPGTTLLCGPVYHSAQWAFSFLRSEEHTSELQSH